MKFQSPHYLIDSQRANIMRPNNNTPMICFVSLNCQGVIFDGANNTEARSLQTKR